MRQYGNAEANDKDTGPGSMEAVFWGEGCGATKEWGPKDGPQVRGDLEDGCWAGKHTANASWGSNTPISALFVTAMLKGDSGNRWALKGGNAQKADGLMTLYDGPRPTSAYHPMRKSGAIILGTGGDNSNFAVGTFFEGVIASGFASEATDAAVHASIASAGYGQVTPFG